MNKLIPQDQFFSRYKYDTDINLLGGGGFGKVYKAFDDTLNRYVAIKISEVNAHQETLSLKKEVELAASLPKHRNIAHYEECFRFKIHNGTFDYGVLQYYPLGNLTSLIKSKSLKISEKESIANGVILGIEHLHINNVIHRDLKSANILIAEGYQGEYVPKIADFGLSKQFTDNEKSYFSNSFAGGSLLYVAPEQLEGKELRKNVDFWSLGVVLYELFVGETPFKANVDNSSETARAEIINNIKYARIPTTISNIPPKWQEVIRACLVTDPAKRIKSIEGVMSMLEDLTVVDQVPPEPTPKPKPDFRPVPAQNLKLNPKWLYYPIGGMLIAAAIILGLRSRGGVVETEKSDSLIVYEENGLYGYKDAMGEVVIEARFEMASPFIEGRGTVSVADSVYYIDPSGTIVELIKPLVKYDVVSSSSEGMMAVKLNGKWGYIDESRREVITLKYDETHWFSEGLVPVKLNGKWGFIDKSGGEVVPFKYDDAGWFSEGLACVKINGKYGFIDKSAREVLPFKYDDANWFSEGLACVKINGKLGFIDRSGHAVIPLKYDGAEPFVYGLAKVELDEKWGWIDKTGHEVIPLKFEEASFFSEGLAAVKLNGKWGYIDNSGREVIPLKYDNTFWFSDGLAVVGLNGKWGYIDKSGYGVIALKYDDAGSFSGGQANVILNGRLFSINKNGECIQGCP